MDAREDKTVEALAVRANLVRSRLVGALGALDRKRQDVLDLESKVKRHLGSAVVALAFVAGVGVALALRAGRARRRRRGPWLLLQSGWRRPELAPAPGSRALFGSLMRVVLAGVGRALLERLLAGVELSGGQHSGPHVGEGPEQPGHRA